MHFTPYSLICEFQRQLKRKDWKKPLYPVIDPNPSFSKTVANLNGDDYFFTSVMTIGPTACLKLVSENNQRVPVAYRLPLFLALFLPFSSLVYWSSKLRLKGQLLNDEEVEFYKNKNC